MREVAPPYSAKPGARAGEQGTQEKPEPPGSLPSPPHLYRERLESFARLCDDWLWETDHRLVLGYLSPPALRFFGLPAEELLGRRLEDLAAPGPAAEELGARLEAKRSFREIDIRPRVGNGSAPLLRLSGEPVVAVGSRRFLGFRGTGRPLTATHGREAELHRALEAAESRSRAKSHFLASMSHELRTPLNAIIGFSEIMRDQHFGPIGSARYQGYAADVHDSACHLLRLINDVLDLAKIEAGKLELEEEAVDPVEMLRAVLRLAAPMGQRAGLRFDTDFASGLPTIVGDERKLKQVLLNLVSNAVKFTPRGQRIAVIVRREVDGALAFQVADRGIGMSADDIEVALAPFGQAAAVRPLVVGRCDLQPGTGLGLPLSKALTELHGGTLELESHPGRGTRVTLRLPSWRVVDD